MFKTRLLSGIVLVILALFLIISGHEILLFATLAISCIGMFELYRVFKMEKTVLAGVGYLAAIVYYCNLQWKFLPDLMILFMAFLILLMFVFVFAYPKFHADQVMAAFFGFFYVAVMLSYVYQIRTLERGLYLAFLVFLCSWGCDTCAYCVGMLIGKHKMSPKLSPKKSVEGLIGGIVGATLLGMAYGALAGSHLPSLGNAVAACGVICGVGAVIAVVGDLTASAIKRDTGIKDYGKLIPGHGGVLDRFDSILFTAPIVYFLAIYFGA